MAPARPLSQGFSQPNTPARTFWPARRALAILAAGGAMFAALAPADGHAAGTVTPPAAVTETVKEQTAFLEARPDHAAPGAVIALSAHGFPPKASVEIGAGPPQSGYEVLDHTTTDSAGMLEHEILLPQRGEPGQIILFVVATEDFMVKAVSNPVTLLRQSPAVAAAD